MANVLEIIVKAKDEASSVLNTVSTNLEKHSKEWKAVGIAMTAVGIAGLKMASDARKMNADLGYTGQIIGITTDEMRAMALELTDVTFGLKSVTNTLELLARAGVKDKDVMKQNALAFDALADATKMDAEVVADILIPAYKMFGQELPKTVNEMDKWTYLVTSTNVSLDELGSLMGHIATYGQDLNLTAEQVVVMMKAMAEQGRDASDAASLLRTGINQAEGSLEKLYRILGISTDEIEKYTKELRNSTGITKDLANQQMSQYTVLDKLKQKWQELTLNLAPVLEVLEPVFSVMSALGPALLAAVYVIPKLVTAFRTLRLAMTAARLEAIAMWGAITLGVSLAITGIIEVINRLKQADQTTEEYNQSLKDLAITMKTDAASAANTVTSHILAENEVAIDAINERRRLWKEAHWERMSQLTEQFMAELAAIAPQAYAKILPLYETWLKTQRAIEGTQAALNELRIQKIGEELKLLSPDKDREQILQLQLELLQLQLPDLDRQFADIMENANINEQDIDAYFDPLETAARSAGLDAAKAFGESWQSEFSNIMNMSAVQLENFIKEKIPEIWAEYFPEQEVPEYELPEPPEEKQSWWEKLWENILKDRGYIPPQTRFQFGGIVTKPTAALIGETGPEAVVPLSQMGMGETHIHVGYLMGDETSLRKFVRHIQQMMGEESRRNQFGQVQSGYYYGRSSI